MLKIGSVLNIVKVSLKAGDVLDLNTHYTVLWLVTY